MDRKPPIPICKAFLMCRDIAEDKHFKDIVLIGICQDYACKRFPAATNISMYARLVSAHGNYLAELQLQTLDGEVVWSGGPQEPWSLNDPLKVVNVKLKFCVAFPEPEPYDFVFLMNGEEVARQRFTCHVSPQPAEM